MKQYADQSRLLVAIDSIIFGFDGAELKRLLIKKQMEPEKGKWSLMEGGRYQVIADGPLHHHQ